MPTRNEINEQETTSKTIANAVEIRDLFLENGFSYEFSAEVARLATNILDIKMLSWCIEKSNGNEEKLMQLITNWVNKIEKKLIGMGVDIDSSTLED